MFWVFIFYERCCHQTKFHHLVGHEVSEVDASATSAGEETTRMSQEKKQSIGIHMAKLSWFCPWKHSFFMFACMLEIIGSLYLVVKLDVSKHVMACYLYVVPLFHVFFGSRLFLRPFKTCRCARWNLTEGNTWKTITLTHGITLVSLYMSLCYHRCSSCWCFFATYVSRGDARRAAPPQWRNGRTSPPRMKSGGAFGTSMSVRGPSA